MVNLQRFPRIFEALLGNNRVSRDITKVNRSSLYDLGWENMNERQRDSGERKKSIDKGIASRTMHIIFKHSSN